MDSLATRAHRTLRDLIPWSLRMDVKQFAKRILRRTMKGSERFPIRVVRGLCFLALRSL